MNRRITITPFAKIASKQASRQCTPITIKRLLAHSGVMVCIGLSSVNLAAAPSIPQQQKTLSKQLNSLRALVLQSADNQKMVMAKHILTATNTQASSRSLPSLWGFFIGSSIETGAHDKNPSTAASFLLPEASTTPNNYDAVALNIGAYYTLNDHFTIGSGANRTVVDAGSRQGAKTDFTSNNLSLFGHFRSSLGYTVHTILSSGSNQYELNRKIATNQVDAKGEAISHSAYAAPSSKETSGTLTAGYTLQQNQTNIHFFSSLSYTDVDIEGYTEKVFFTKTPNGGISASANIHEIDLQSLTRELGLSVYWDIKPGRTVYTPSLLLASHQQFKDNAVDIHGRFIDELGEAPLNYSAPNRDRHYINAQLSVTATFANGFTGRIGYSTHLKQDDLEVKNYELTARWTF